MIKWLLGFFFRDEYRGHTPAEIEILKRLEQTLHNRQMSDKAVWVVWEMGEKIGKVRAVTETEAIAKANKKFFARYGFEDRDRFSVTLCLGKSKK